MSVPNVQVWCVALSGFFYAIFHLHMVRPSYAYTLKPVEDTHLSLTNWLLVGGVLLIELPAKLVINMHGI